MLSEVGGGGGGLASVLGNNQSLFFIYLLFFCLFGFFFFCMTENWICTMNRYDVEANINMMSVHRNLPFDSKVRQ